MEGDSSEKEEALRFAFHSAKLSELSSQSPGRTSLMYMEIYKPQDSWTPASGVLDSSLIRETF